MNIRQFRYSADNLAYLVYGDKTAIAIDAGAVNEILSFAEEAGVSIKYVINTHSHYDHTSGNSSMLEKTDAEFLDCKSLQNHNSINLDGEKLRIFHTPGHTLDGLTFKTCDAIISGDTLFNGTVGTCFSGDTKSFLNSINFLMNLPQETIVYSGHDYIKESIAFAKTIDKNNPELDNYLNKRNPYHVFSTIADERKVNPFVRYNDAKLIAIMKERGMPVATEYERWNSLHQFPLA